MGQTQSNAAQYHPSAVGFDNREASVKPSAPDLKRYSALRPDRLREASGSSSLVGQHHRSHSLVSSALQQQQQQQQPRSSAEAEPRSATLQRKSLAGPMRSRPVPNGLLSSMPFGRSVSAGALLSTHEEAHDAQQQQALADELLAKASSSLGADEPRLSTTPSPAPSYRRMSARLHPRIVEVPEPPDLVQEFGPGRPGLASASILGSEASDRGHHPPYPLSEPLVRALQAGLGTVALSPELARELDQAKRATGETDRERLLAYWERYDSSVGGSKRTSVQSANTRLRSSWASGSALSVYGHAVPQNDPRWTSEWEDRRGAASPGEQSQSLPTPLETDEEWATPADTLDMTRFSWTSKGTTDAEAEAAAVSGDEAAPRLVVSNSEAGERPVDRGGARRPRPGLPTPSLLATTTESPTRQNSHTSMLSAAAASSQADADLPSPISTGGFADEQTVTPIATPVVPQQQQQSRRKPPPITSEVLEAEPSLASPTASLPSVLAPGPCRPSSLAPSSITPSSNRSSTGTMALHHHVDSLRAGPLFQVDRDASALLLSAEAEAGPSSGAAAVALPKRPRALSIMDKIRGRVRLGSDSWRSAAPSVSLLQRKQPQQQQQGGQDEDGQSEGMSSATAMPQRRRSIGIGRKRGDTITVARLAAEGAARPASRSPNGSVRSRPRSVRSARSVRSKRSSAASLRNNYRNAEGHAAPVATAATGVQPAEAAASKEAWGPGVPSELRAHLAPHSHSLGLPPAPLGEAKAEGVKEAETAWEDVDEAAARAARDSADGTEPGDSVAGTPRVGAKHRGGWSWRRRGEGGATTDSTDRSRPHSTSSSDAGAVRAAVPSMPSPELALPVDDTPVVRIGQPAEMLLDPVSGGYGSSQGSFSSLAPPPPPAPLPPRRPSRKKNGQASSAGDSTASTPTFSATDPSADLRSSLEGAGVEPPSPLGLETLPASKASMALPSFSLDRRPSTALSDAGTKEILLSEASEQEEDAAAPAPAWQPGVVVRRPRPTPPTMLSPVTEAIGFTPTASPSVSGSALAAAARGEPSPRTARSNVPAFDPSDPDDSRDSAAFLAAQRSIGSLQKHSHPRDTSQADSDMSFSSQRSGSDFGSVATMPLAASLARHIRTGSMDTTGDSAAGSPRRAQPSLPVVDTAQVHATSRSNRAVSLPSGPPAIQSSLLGIAPPSLEARVERPDWATASSTVRPLPVPRPTASQSFAAIERNRAPLEPRSLRPATVRAFSPQLRQEARRARAVSAPTRPELPSLLRQMTLADESPKTNSPPSPLVEEGEADVEAEEAVPFADTAVQASLAALAALELSPDDGWRARWAREKLLGVSEVEPVTDSVLQQSAASSRLSLAASQSELSDLYHARPRRRAAPYSRELRKSSEGLAADYSSGGRSDGSRRRSKTQDQRRVASGSAIGSLRSNPYHARGVTGMAEGQASSAGSDSELTAFIAGSRHRQPSSATQSVASRRRTRRRGDERAPHTIGNRGVDQERAWEELAGIRSTDSLPFVTPPRKAGRRSEPRAPIPSFELSPPVVEHVASPALALASPVQPEAPAGNAFTAWDEMVVPALRKRIELEEAEEAKIAAAANASAAKLVAVATPATSSASPISPSIASPLQQHEALTTRMAANGAAPVASGSDPSPSERGYSSGSVPFPTHRAPADSVSPTLRRKPATISLVQRSPAASKARRGQSDCDPVPASALAQVFKPDVSAHGSERRRAKSGTTPRSSGRKSGVVATLEDSHRQPSERKRYHSSYHGHADPQASMSSVPRSTTRKSSTAGGSHKSRRPPKQGYSGDDILAWQATLAS